MESCSAALLVPGVAGRRVGAACATCAGAVDAPFARMLQTADTATCACVGF